MNPRQPMRSGSSAPPQPPEREEQGFSQNGSHPPVVAKFVQLDRISLPTRPPRRYFNEEAMQQLTASIREHGVLQPLVVREVLGDRQYELVSPNTANSRGIISAVNTTRSTVTGSLVVNYVEEINPWLR